MTAAIVMVALLGVSACTGTSTRPPTTTTPPRSTTSGGGTGGTGGCAAPATARVDASGVPSCGVLWGLATQPATLAGVEAVEQQVGRSFDLVYRYHDLVDTIPDKEEKAVVARGSLLHVAIASRKFGGGDVSYADVASGAYDASLRKQAQGIAALAVPVYVTFEQEANQRDKVGQRGSAAEFIAAWRHLHALYAAEKVTNAVWVWVMTGNAANLSVAGSLWPGNDQVDWISWNIYNQSGCRNRKIDVAKYVSFEDGVKEFFSWVTSSGPALGIDPGKPMMISETGTAQYPDDPGRSAQWYADIPAALAAYPQVKAVTLWASGGGGSEGGTCDYRFQNNPAVAAGVTRAGQQLEAAAGSPGPSSTSSTGGTSTP